MRSIPIAIRRFVSIRLVSISLVSMSIVTGLAGVGSATDIQVVVPNSAELVDAASGNKVPFSYPPARYQQINFATEFSAITAPSLVTEIAFRVDKSVATFTHTIDNLQVNLSTAASSPLSGSYATNVGSDDTIVYSGPLQMSVASASGMVRPFEIVIPLATPFLYDPTAGDLLLDLRLIDNTNPGVVGYIDSYTVPGQFARVFCNTTCSVDDNGGQIDGGFLITRFTFAPEPEVGATGAIAMLALAWLARRRSPRSTPT